MDSKLNLRQIFSFTTPERFYKATQVKIEYLKFGTSRALGVQKAICRSHSIGEGRASAQEKYVTMIEFHPGGTVRVACSCQDHLFRWEVALAKRGASYITYSDGERPRETNPKMEPGCCKHVVALARILKQRDLLPKTHAFAALAPKKATPKSKKSTPKKKA